MVSILFVVVTQSFGFTTNSHIFARKAFTLHASDSDKDGGAAIAKPKVGVKVETVTKQKAKSVSKQKARTSDPISRREEGELLACE